MNTHDPLCPGDEVWRHKSKPCPTCRMLRAARNDERQLLAEDIGNMMRRMPYADFKCQEAVDWAHRYVTGIWDDGDAA